ncbi:hypothetical protein GCM10027404_23040 [Arthrobacter tumbae]|uniref:hypothetical protein n=1 Tax=Arthrobacter tumbae TaxID=163874 RepID=UPI00195731FF|nr:hypothetical protein [Arthrobacter tumbae]MBM7781329.1 hypothetical protein [Arthrobacter tumbae]
MAALSSGLWFGWFAWDTEYHYDPAAGEMAGPYELWQGIGAFLCSFVVVALAYRLLHFIVALMVVPASFTFAWISTAAATDDTGLWLVGALLVAFGTTAGAALMLGIAAAVEAAREPA